MLRFVTSAELKPSDPIAVLHRHGEQVLVVMNGHVTDSALRCDAVNMLLAALPAASLAA